MQRIQADEIWSFIGCKQRNVATAKAVSADAGDVWTWTALDADMKLMVSYFVGELSTLSRRNATFSVETQRGVLVGPKMGPACGSPIISN